VKCLTLAGHLCAVALGLATGPAAAQAGRFHQVETLSTVSSTAEYARLARLAHDTCNAVLRAQGRAPAPFPSLPEPLVIERVWTLSDGRDFVLRKLERSIEPGESEEGCNTRLGWTERTVIHRNGRTVAVFRDSAGQREIDRQYSVGPWDPPNTAPLAAYERVVEVQGLRLRCGDPNRAGLGQPIPNAQVSETCTTVPPLRFRDEFGHDLVLQSQASFQFFGGRGGRYTVTQRPQGFRLVQPDPSAWQPETYLRD
jgi:hypothetical protein